MRDPVFGRRVARDFRNMARKLRRAVNRVEQIIRIAQEPMSLETPISAEEDSYLGDFIKDETMPEPDDAASKQLLREQMRAIYETFKDRVARGRGLEPAAAGGQAGAGACTAW